MAHQRLLFLLMGIFIINPASASMMDKVSQGISNVFYNMIYLPAGIVKFILESIKFSRQELNDADVPDGAEYDFVIVGSGSAGAVIANRLTEVNATVLLIEAGGHEYRLFDIPVLALFLQVLGVNWDFRTEPSNDYCRGIRGNSCRWAAGKVMGGTSTVNGMVAVRGNPEGDYNQWAAWGNEGWSFNDVLPYFKKLETAIGIGGPGYKPELRGTSGPVPITYTWSSKVARSYVKAAQEIGYQALDYNGENQVGFSILQSNIKNGERFSTNRAYLQPIKGRKNLDVTMHSMVQKVNIDSDSKRADGVTFMKHGKKITVKAKKEVILSAGALQSPKLLMLSGVGPAAHLNEFQIKVIKDAPGVGQNLMDHVTFFGQIYLINTTDTPTIDNWFLPWNKDFAQYFRKREGPVGSTSLLGAAGFVNTENQTSAKSNVELLYADVSITFDEVYIFQKIILELKQKIFFKMYAKYSNRHAYQILPILVKPQSRGELRLRSADILDYPKFIPNYYKHPDDVKTMIAAIRIGMKLSESEALQKFGAKLVPSPVVGCEHFTFNSDPYWECALRTLTLSLWHYAGTAKMGPKTDPMAVVDNRLKVYGVDGLRVIDASIMPLVPSAHTNVPTMMIGERASDLIKEDWGFMEKKSPGPVSTVTENNDEKKEITKENDRLVNSKNSETFMENIDNSSGDGGAKLEN